ncbi:MULTISPECIES: DUF6538 domain-containing protein [Mameliella]|uniref:DUF6538 domain-containing protein n=1 Tax=Mameliella TaxID=1434019 RepID=UPI000B537D73|nr:MULTISPECIES: DUF6538 domain-containing protein [Mameliella]MCR9276177.1 hypothetical protein [Paracoccaceae bacterium]OWV62935.1 hypothetical protein CDZ98_01825 [Mameliella alba]
MGIVMAKPVKRGDTYYLRVSVPRDVAEAAKGTKVAVPVGDDVSTVTIGAWAKTSLRTKDRDEAKRRFTLALAAVEQHWQALRAGPLSLTHKEALALAGEVREAFIDAFDDEPGQPERWTRILATDALARGGGLNPLAVPTAATVARDLELRFGAFVDGILRRHGLIVDEASRGKVLHQVSLAMVDVGLVNYAKAQGDYSDSGETDRYPAFTPKTKAQGEKGKPQVGVTFTEVINAEIRRRAAGKEAKPMPEGTARKYRQVVNAFSAFRKSDLVGTVTPQEADAWKWEMLEGGSLSNSTIAQRIQNVSTVIGWARVQSVGTLFPDRNPLDLVVRPERNGVRSEDRTLRMEEAVTILRAARQETKPDLRWLPWMCAYSGARVSEVAQLRPDDFFQFEGSWFFRLTTKGRKTLKNVHSIRRVPVHPDLVAEGLIEFVNRHREHPEQRLFHARSQGNVAGWVRSKLKLTREDMAPSHGWRHLFEDKAMYAGMLDSAKTYITGRSKGRSAEGYGKSDVMLPGLAAEMRKIKGYLAE